MKLALLALLALVGAIEFRSAREELQFRQQHEAVIEKSQSLLREIAVPAEAASVDELLAEVKQRVVVCGESVSPLAGLSLKELFAELKKRDAAKVCEETSEGEGGDAGQAAEEEPAAKAEETTTTATTTTTTTTPCPDNFMDEVVDQANPDFEMWDTNKDGCLTGSEMTATLKKQIDIAKHRDYYWIRRNVTNAARGLIKDWRKGHGGADENDSGCVNREELEAVQQAVCDCPTQFMFMDHNADGKVSRQEASTYVSEHMVHADLNWSKLNAIWKAVDVNGDKYLSQKEFCEAGPRYKGDGKEPGPVPGPAPGPAPAL